MSAKEESFYCPKCRNNSLYASGNGFPNDPKRQIYMVISLGRNYGIFGNVRMEIIIENYGALVMSQQFRLLMAQYMKYFLMKHIQLMKKIGMSVFQIVNV